MPPKVLENTFNIIVGIFSRSSVNTDTDPKGYSLKQYRYTSGKVLGHIFKVTEGIFSGCSMYSNG